MSSGEDFYGLKPRKFDANSEIFILDANEYDDDTRSPLDFNHIDVPTIRDRIQVKNGKDIGRWKRFTQKTKVKELLIAWQCKHFTQSSSTPFLTQKWSKLLMEKKVQNQTINGSSEPPESLHPLAKIYLQRIQRDKCVDKE